MYIDQEATNEDMVAYFRNVLDATSEINKKQMMEMIRSVFLSAVSPSTLTDAYASMLPDRSESRELNPPEAIPITPVINAPLYVSTQNIEFDTQFDISAKAVGALSQPGTFTYVHSPWKGWKEIVAFVEWSVSAAYTLTGASVDPSVGPTLCQQLPVGPSASYTDIADSWLMPYGIPALMIPPVVTNPFVTANQVFSTTTCGTQAGAPYGAAHCQVAQLYRCTAQSPNGYNFGPYVSAPGVTALNWQPSNGFLWNPGQIKPYVPKSNSSTATYDRILIAGPPKYQLNPGFQLDQNYSMGRILSLFFSCSVTPNASGTTANGKVQMALISDAIQPSFTTAVLKQQGGKNYISTALTETVDTKSGTSIGGGTYCLGPNVLQKLIPLTDELEAGEGHGGLLTDVTMIALPPHGTANSLLPITGVDFYANTNWLTNSTGPSIGPVPCNVTLTQQRTPGSIAFDVSVPDGAASNWTAFYGPNITSIPAPPPNPAFVGSAASSVPYIFGSAAISVGACDADPGTTPIVAVFPGATGTPDATNLSLWGPKTRWTGASAFAAIAGNTTLSAYLPLWRVTGWNWASAYDGQGTADPDSYGGFAKNMITDNFGGAFSWMGCISHSVQPYGGTYAKMKSVEESAILTGPWVSGLTPHMPFSGNSVTQTPIQSVMIPRPPEGLPPVFKFEWTIGPGATRACSMGQGFHLYMRAKHDGTFEQSSVPFAFGRWPGCATMSTYGNQQPRPQEIAALGGNAVSTIYTNLGNLPHPDFGSLFNGVGADIVSGGMFNQISQTIRVPRVPTGAVSTERWSYMATYVGLHAMTDATCSCTISAQYPRYYDTGVIGPAFVTLVSGLTEGQQFSVQLQQIHQVIANAATSALGINAAQSYSQPPLVNMAFPRLIDALFSNGKSQFFRCVKTNAEFRRSVFKLYAAGDIFSFLADVVARDGAVNDPAQPEIRELAKIATSAAAIQNMGDNGRTAQALAELRDDVDSALKRMRTETPQAVEEAITSGGWFSKLKNLGSSVIQHAGDIHNVVSQVAGLASQVSALKNQIQSAGGIGMIGARGMVRRGGYDDDEVGADGPGMIGADGPGMIGADGPGMIGADGPGMIGADGDEGMIGAEGECENDVSAGGIAYNVKEKKWTEIVGGSPNGLEGVTVVGAPFIPVRRIEQGKQLTNSDGKTLLSVIQKRGFSIVEYNIKDGMKKLLATISALLMKPEYKNVKSYDSIVAVVREVNDIVESLSVTARAAPSGEELRAYVFTKASQMFVHPRLEQMLEEVMGEPVHRMIRKKDGTTYPATRKYLSPMSDYKMVFLKSDETKFEKLITGSQWGQMMHLHKYGAPMTKSGFPSRRSVEFILEAVSKRPSGETFVLYYQIVVTAMLTWMALGDKKGMMAVNKYKLDRMLAPASNTEYITTGAAEQEDDEAKQHKYLKGSRFEFTSRGGFRGAPVSSGFRASTNVAPPRPRPVTYNKATMEIANDYPSIFNVENAADDAEITVAPNGKKFNVTNLPGEAVTALVAANVA